MRPSNPVPRSPHHRQSPAPPIRSYSQKLDLHDVNELSDTERSVSLVRAILSQSQLYSPSATNTHIFTDQSQKVITQHLDSHGLVVANPSTPSDMAGSMQHDGSSKLQYEDEEVMGINGHKEIQQPNTGHSRVTSDDSVIDVERIEDSLKTRLRSDSHAVHVARITVAPYTSHAAAHATRARTGSNASLRSGSTLPSNTSSYRRLPLMQPQHAAAKRCSNLRVAVTVATVLTLIITAVLVLPDLLDTTLTYLNNVDHSSNVGIVFFLLTILTSAPATPGYGFVLLSCAYIFGWQSFPILYIASICGGVIWFSVSRHLSLKYNVTANTLLSWYPSVKYQMLAVQRAVGVHTFKVSLLLQLTVLPFGVVTAVLGSWNVSLSAYVLSIMISRLKILTYIWLATSVDDLRLLFSSQRSLTASDYVRLSCGIVFSVVSLLVITMFARQQLEVMREAGELQQSEARLNSNHDIDDIYDDGPTSQFVNIQSTSSLRSSSPLHKLLKTSKTDYDMLNADVSPPPAHPLLSSFSGSNSLPSSRSQYSQIATAPHTPAMASSRPFTFAGMSNSRSVEFEPPVKAGRQRAGSIVSSDINGLHNA